MIAEKKSPAGDQKLAKIYHKQSTSDLKEAKSAIKQGDFSKSALLFNQAAMNSLCSICIARGKHQNPTYHLSELLTVATTFISELESIKNEAETLDQIHEKTLFRFHKQKANLITKSDLESYQSASEAIVKFCGQVIKKHRIF